MANDKFAADKRRWGQTLRGILTLLELQQQLVCAAMDELGLPEAETKNVPKRARRRRRTNNTGRGKR